MGRIFSPSLEGFLPSSEVGSDVITIPVSFSPIQSGTRIGSLVVAGNMDAGDLEVPLTGTVDEDTKHARSMERMLPTGSAWHGETIKAFMRGLGIEMAFVEREIKDRASIENMLHGMNRSNWARALGIIEASTDAEIDAAIDRKLADVGGLRAADMTRELQAAGFDLTVYPNKWIQTPDPETYGSSYFGFSTFSTMKRYNFRDLRYLENFIPYWTFGSSYFGSSTFGLARSNEGAELVVNSIEGGGDNALWANLPNETQRYLWHYGFIISGDEIFDIKKISADRQRELRRLIIELKPLGMWAFLICDYE